MPLTWEVLHPDRLVIATLEGQVAYRDLEGFIAALSAEGAIPYGKLFDTRRGSSALTESELMSYTGMAAGYASTAPLGPVALVVAPKAAPDDATLRRLAIIPRAFAIFYDIDDARRWLERQVASAPPAP
ncbi:hypothetical protein SAMN02745126_02086 [Enhydrobacter aerosaccus]|uniref:SpoIIAA-like n=1 Tax=Enhydrobacter aerosaccus TaxID=225324 RepID=A0A1T4N386_9HYPH|nr:hypothetical protein [Enhydrobacter aerosaccus]SJZ73682.1 hypothetical protein SAMN02745126_02086 [Enhydrobacter aerosaccus]